MKRLQKRGDDRRMNESLSYPPRLILATSGLSILPYALIYKTVLSSIRVYSVKDVSDIATKASHVADSRSKYESHLK